MTSAVFFGILPGVRIAVDRFDASSLSQVSAVFLTHFHADHYLGLNESYRGPPVYCSPLTREFLLHRFPGIDGARINALELLEPHALSLRDGERVLVRLLPANHCPGAVMILFDGAFGRYLHTGDFRFSSELGEVLQRALGSTPVDRAFVDCTFGDAYWRSLPSLADSTAEFLSVIDRVRRERVDVHVLVDCEMLGHEALLHALHAQTQQLIRVEPTRMCKLAAIPELQGALTETDDAQFEVVHVGSSRYRALVAETSRRFAVVKPSTQWFGHRSQARLDARTRQDESGVWHVLHSIHSSLEELCAFAALVRPRAITPITPIAKSVLELLLTCARRGVVHALNAPPPAQVRSDRDRERHSKLRQRALSLNSNNGLKRSREAPSEEEEGRPLKRQRSEVTLSSVLSSFDLPAKPTERAPQEQRVLEESEDEDALFERILSSAHRGTKDSGQSKGEALQVGASHDEDATQLLNLPREKLRAVAPNADVSAAAVVEGNYEREREISSAELFLLYLED